MHACEVAPVRDALMRWPWEMHAYERQVYEMVYGKCPPMGDACEMHAYEMVYGRGTHMRDTRL
jgi:hypothetical protein